MISTIYINNKYFNMDIFIDFHLKSKCCFVSDGFLCRHESKKHNGLCDIHQNCEKYLPKDVQDILNNYMKKTLNLCNEAKKQHKILLVYEMFENLSLTREVLCSEIFIDFAKTLKRKIHEFINDPRVSLDFIEKMNLYDKYLFPHDFQLTLDDYKNVQEKLNILIKS